MDRFIQGAEAAREGRWEQAREAFLDVWQMRPSFGAALDLGQAELMSGRYRDAAERLHTCLREALPHIPASARQEAHQLLAQAQAKIGTATVEVDVAGADVTVDGTAIGRSPIAEPVFVNPGPHVFEARREGHGPGRVAMEVAAGSRPKVTLHLVHVAPPAAQNAQPATPGSHDDARTARWRPWAIAGGAALAGAGIGLGIGFTVASNSEASDALDLQGDLKLSTSSDQPICLAGSPAQNKAMCDALARALDDRDGFRTGAIVDYAIGGAAAVGTVVLAALPRKVLEPSTGLRVTPLLSPVQSGALITGSF